MISPLTIDACNNSFHGSYCPLIFNLETCISAPYPCSHHFFRLHGIYATQSACVSSSGQSTERSWLECLPTNHLKLKESSFHPRDFSTGKPPQESNHSFQLVVQYPRLWKERQLWTLSSNSTNYYRQHWRTTCRAHLGTLSPMQLGFQHGILEKHVYSEFSFGPRVHWIKVEVSPIDVPNLNCSSSIYNKMTLLDLK